MFGSFKLPSNLLWELSNFEKVRLMFSIFYMGEVNEEGYILKHVRYKCNEMLSLQCLAR